MENDVPSSNANYLWCQKDMFEGTFLRPQNTQAGTTQKGEEQVQIVEQQLGNERNLCAMRELIRVNYNIWFHEWSSILSLSNELKTVLLPTDQDLYRRRDIIHFRRLPEMQERFKTMCGIITKPSLDHIETVDELNGILTEINNELKYSYKMSQELRQITATAKKRNGSP